MRNDYREFSLRLKEERARCGLTQQQLCDDTEMQQSAFSRVETGYLRLTYPKLKKICASGVDLFYIFTGNKPADRLDFLEPSAATPEVLLCLMGIVYIQACAVQAPCRTFAPSHTCLKGPHEVPFEQIRKQLSYLQYLSGDVRANRNIFCRLRNHHGYTQRKMADLLGMDIKTLRNLEKGRRLPDSELIWKTHHLFHVSPALILNDPLGLRNELNYVLGLLTDDDRDVMLQILESSYKLVSG